MFKDQTERLSTTVDQKLHLLGGHVTTLTQSLDSQVNQLTHSVEGQLHLLDDRIGAVTQAFDRQVHQMSDRVDTRLELLGGRAVELADAMDRQIDRLAGTVDSKLNEISGVLSTRTNEVSAVLGNRAAELASAFETQISRFDHKVSERIDGLSSAFGERGEEIARLIGGTGETLTENLTHRLVTIKVDIERASATAAHTLDQGATSLVASFEGGVREFSTASRAPRPSCARRSMTARAIRSMRSPMRMTRCAARSAVFSTASAPRTACCSRSCRAPARASERSRPASPNVSRTSNTCLGGIVSETNRAASRVADQVGALNSVSSSTLRNAETLLEKLENQAQVLSDATEAQTRGWNEAADLLERVEARIARSLTSKREALETLTTSINGRSEELDKVTGAFRTMIEESAQRRRGQGTAHRRGAERELARLGRSDRRAIRPYPGDHRSRARSHRGRAARGL